ncbi:MAG: PDZ domain-containing protein [Planctomycetota bacterium]|nr:MAG: PDZ domain-containing protein [Planctomycetota bacterium]
MSIKNVRMLSAVLAVLILFALSPVPAWAQGELIPPPPPAEGEQEPAEAEPAEPAGAVEPRPEITVAEMIREVMEKARPLVAHVSFKIQTDSGKSKVECTGFVASEDGLVIVNAKHFSESYASDDYLDFEVQLELPDGPKTYEADYLGKDVVAKVAAIRINELKDDEKLSYVEFSEEAPVAVGDQVVVVGHMGKQFNYKRDYRLGRVTAVIEKPVKQYSLTPGASHNEDALILSMDGFALGILRKSGGSSGGGRTFRFGGRFRGFRSFRSGGGGSLNMLYPSEHFAKVIANPPTRKAEKEKSWLGVMGLQELTKELAEYWGLGEEKGVIIGHVIEGGPADKMGLKAEDVVLEVNGKRLDTDQGTSVTAFQAEAKKVEAGGDIELVVYRESGKVTLSGKIGASPKPVGKAKKEKFKEEFKFTVRELVFFDLYDRDLPIDHPGCIVHYYESGWAADGGLRSGDIITKIGNDAVEDVGHFKKLFDAKIAGKPREVILTVLRGRTNQSVLVRIECHWK